MAVLVQKLGKANGLHGMVSFTVSDPDSVWTLGLSSTPPQVRSGDSNDASATVRLTDSALVELVSGKCSLRAL